MKRSRFVVRAYLSKQRGIGSLRNRPFSQLAMKRRNHFSAAVCRACHVVRCRQGTDFVGSRIVEIKPDEIARVEIDHTISRSRSSLINFVESTPPLRCLRCARNARVKRGIAKNGFTGEGRAGTIFAINRPLSVTFTSPAAACRTHAPVAL
jgi:hypothetical protein